MSESIRTQIFNDVRNALENITIANGYNQDVVSVKTNGIDAPETFEEFPILFVIDSDETKKPLDVNSTENELQVIITGYCKKLNDEDDIQLKRQKLQADVEKAIMVDERRNNLALSTDVIDLKTDKGLLEPYSIFDLTIKIKYYTNKYNPYEIA